MILRNINIIIYIAKPVSPVSAAVGCCGPELDRKRTANELRYIYLPNIYKYNNIQSRVFPKYPFDNNNIST